MHQRGKNLTALVLALCIVLSLTACGGGGESDPLAAALENMEKLESMDVVNLRFSHLPKLMKYKKVRL